MLGLQDRLRRKDEEVIAKMVDGEAIIINLANGVYYSLDNAGAAMWQMIEEYRRLGDIAAAIAVRFDVALRRAEEDVLRLAGELLHEEVVALTDSDAESPAAEPAVAHALPYESPQLNAYRDMEDLLALDPPTPSFTDIPWKQ